MAHADPLDQATRDDASLRDLAHDSSEYVRCWSALVASETRLAQAGIVRLVFASLILPALVLAVVLSADAMIACVANRWFNDWSSSVGLTLVLDLMAVYGLIVAMRRWLANLSLPRSRRALSRMLERLA